MLLKALRRIQRTGSEVIATTLSPPYLTSSTRLTLRVDDLLRLQLVHANPDRMSALDALPAKARDSGKGEAGGWTESSVLFSVDRQA